jgi:hypothetical protein
MAKEFRDIQINESEFQGKIIEDPAIAPTVDGEAAIMKLEVWTAELGANGQWADIPVIIPLYVMDQNKVTTVKNYIKEGRRLFVKAYYKSWMAGNVPQHGFIVTQMKLGSKPYEPKPEDDAPALPTV